MAHKILYGPHEYRVDNDEQVVTFLKGVEDAINGDGPRWVDVPDTQNTRIFITTGVPIAVVKVKTGSRSRVVVMS